MKWKFCQCCFLDGHCENQDRGHRCETYPKQLEDKVERLQEQLADASKTIQDQELIIKKLKRRRICSNQKEKARKEHINELIAQVAKQKEEIAKRGSLINELKSQRKEANELIKDYGDEYPVVVKEYLEKWGVK